MSLPRLAWILAGLALAVVSFASESLRDVEGTLDTPVALIWSAGAACALLAAGVGRSWQLFSRWAALLVVGQAATLQLYDAGTHVTYQHYRLWGQRAPGVLPYAIFALEIAAVAIGLARLGGAPWRALGERLGRARLLALLLLCLVVSAKPSNPPGYFPFELGFATFVELVHLGCVALAALALLPGDARAFERAAQRGLGPEAQPPAGVQPLRARELLDPFVVSAALWCFALCACLTIVSYERHPHIPDEVIYLLHARYLAAGRLMLELPPVLEAFDLDIMLRTSGTAGEHWASPFPIGWPLLLAVGVKLGAFWLVNPLLSALGVVLGHAFARELLPARSARLFVIALCVSPWFLFIGMSYMSHPWSLVCLFAAGLGVLRARSSPVRPAVRLAWAALAGAAIGMLSLIRPLEGITFAALAALPCIGLAGPRLSLACLGAATLGGLAVGLPGLAYNRHLTGDPLRFPVMAYFDQAYEPGCNDLGFGPDRGVGWSGIDPWPGHSPLEAGLNAQFNLFQIDLELLGWATGSLVLVFFWLLCGRWRREDLWWLLVAVAVVGSNSLYWFAGGPDFGARYWYPILVPCIWLTLRGLEELRARLSRGSSDPQAARGRVLVAAALLSGAALVDVLPWRAVDKYHHFRDLRPDVRELAREQAFGRSLVLVRGERTPDLEGAMTYNPLEHDADAPIYVWDRSAKVRRALHPHYADRPVWVLDGPSRTGTGYRVVAGPLPAEALLADDLDAYLLARSSKQLR